MVGVVAIETAIVVTSVTPEGTDFQFGNVLMAFVAFNKFCVLVLCIYFDEFVSYFAMVFVLWKNY